MEMNNTKHEEEWKVNLLKIKKNQMKQMTTGEEDLKQ